MAKKVNSFALIFLLVAVFVLSVSPAFANKVGVGVGTGAIKVGEPLKAGKTYNLPPIVVINTGDVASDYEVRVAHRENQLEHKPPEEWFVFEPQGFRLEPGSTKLVNITLSLPVKGAEPGDYFAFMQARPIIELEAGMTSVGVAAASQLRFSVVPGNIFQAFYFKFGHWYSHYHPWNTIILSIIFLAILLVFIKRKFKIQISKK